MSSFLNTRVGLIVALIVVLGAAWGVTVPLAKIAVSTGYQQFGMIFWQLAFSLLYLGVVAGLQGKFPKCAFRGNVVHPYR